MTPVYFHGSGGTASFPELDHIPRVGELVDLLLLGRCIVTEVRHDLIDGRIHITITPETP